MLPFILSQDKILLKRHFPSIRRFESNGSPHPIIDTPRGGEVIYEVGSNRESGGERS